MRGTVEKLNGQRHIDECMERDSTFEFERKRNRPERYDQNLAENVLKTILKIDKIRVAVSRHLSHGRVMSMLHFLAQFGVCVI
ncbi:hypothetical protein VNO78_05804 [Psophocarpus tetragonolobus]|uniref:Uncharacterized protein n=1 Tax=Psophocarpus tetragonolobus TaxID=3891 RepID=A0AAN9T0K6_PSOTE